MLKTIRSKPHHIKQWIALALSTVIFSAIVFVWVSSGDARSREVEVQAKTVSPIEGVTSMFSGFISGITSEMLKMSEGGIQNDSAPITTDPVFDMSGVVVIDPSISVSTTSMGLTAQKSLLPTGQATSSTSTNMAL